MPATLRSRLDGLLVLKKINQTDKLVILTIASLGHGKGHETSLSNSHLADRIWLRTNAGLKRQAINRSLNKLTRLGFLHRREAIFKRRISKHGAGMPRRFATVKCYWYKVNFDAF